jgi:hypothetical protein
LSAKPEKVAAAVVEVAEMVCAAVVVADLVKGLDVGERGAAELDAVCPEVSDLDIPDVNVSDLDAMDLEVSELDIEDPVVAGPGCVRLNVADLDDWEAFGVSNGGAAVLTCESERQNLGIAEIIAV